MGLSVQQTFAASRLSLIDDVLVTAGWTQHQDGWLPPERYRRAIEIANGRGRFARHLAIAMAAQADQAVMQGSAPFDAEFARVIEHLVAKPAEEGLREALDLAEDAIALANEWDARMWEGPGCRVMDADLADLYHRQRARSTTGETKRQWQYDPSVDWRTRKLAGDAAEVIDQLRTRKPAPDARDDLIAAIKPFAEIAPYVEFTPHRDGEKVHEQQDPATGKWHHLWRKDFREAKRAYDAALAAPVPPADGAMNDALAAHYGIPDELWKGASKDNPMVPSGTGAAEPVAWRWQSRQLAGWHYQDSEPVAGGPVAKVEPLYAAPPVRGDREALARIIEPWSWHHKDRGTASNQVMAQVEDSLLRADAILSLPVQSGADERPRWRHKKRGTFYTEIGRGELQTMDAGGLTDGEPMVIYQGDDGKIWVRDAVEFEDGRFEFVPPSRQTPPSSSERIRTAPESCPQCFDESDCSSIDVCRAVATTDASPKGDGNGQ